MLILSNGPGMAPASDAGNDTGPVLVPAAGGDAGAGGAARTGAGPRPRGFGDVFAGLLRGVVSPGPKEPDAETAAEMPPDADEQTSEEADTGVAGDAAVPLPAMAGRPGPDGQGPRTPVQQGAEGRAPVAWPEAAGVTVAANDASSSAVRTGMPAQAGAGGQGAGVAARAEADAIAGRALRGGDSAAKPPAAPAGPGDVPQPVAVAGRAPFGEGAMPAGPVPPPLAAGTRAQGQQGNAAGAPPEGAAAPAVAVREAPVSTAGESGPALARSGNETGAGVSSGPEAPSRSAVPLSDSAATPEGAQDTPRPAPAPSAPAANDATANRAPAIAASPSATPDSVGAAGTDPAGADTPQAADMARADRPGSTPAPGQPTQGAPGAAARAVTPQIAAAVQAGGERSVEIVLSPAELGKVRIALSPGEGGMAVNIVAERPETLDLLRRHADLLAQDFRDLGYEGTKFSFGAGGGAPGRDGEPVSDASAAPADPAEATAAGDPTIRARQSDHARPDGRMDIRL